MQLLDGKKISVQLIEKLTLITKNIIDKHERKPHLTAIMVGNNSASQTYVNSKVKMCQRIGFSSTLIHKKDIVTENEILSIIKIHAIDENVDGILVQLPLPKHIDEYKIFNAIPVEKDVDGFHVENVGKLLLGVKEGFVSATPLGIKLLFEQYGISTSGKKVVMIGRSSIVGKPLVSMLLSNNPIFGNATVTVCHSKTQDIKTHTKDADIIIVAIGKTKFLKADMIKDGSVIIDVGINRILENGKKKLVGDVDFDEVSKKASFITPVPGGVGKMTIASLMYNTLKAYLLRNNEDISVLEL